MPLLTLLREIREGHIQVPTFQRPVVLREDWVATLLASVTLGYPIGAVMLLEPDYAAYAIETRPVAGAPPTSVQPRRLLVDGQHRLAALYQALGTPEMDVVNQAGERCTRSFALDVRAALDPETDRDSAIRVTSPGEVRGGQFPLALLLGPESQREAWRRDAAARLPVARFEQDVVARLEDYRLPVIHLEPSWTRWTIRVRGGVDGPSLSDTLRRGPR
jgi:hypothetical protein